MLKALSHQELRRQSRKYTKGGEGKRTKYITAGRMWRASDTEAYFHTFRRHDCAIWLSSTFHYVVWRCFLLTTISWYLTLWSPYAFCHRSSVETSHFEFQTAKHWVSTLRYMVPMKMQRLDYFALYWKQIFYLFFPFVIWTADVEKLATHLLWLR